MSLNRAFERLKIDQTEVKTKEPGRQIDVSGPKSKDYQPEADNTQFSRPPWARQTNPEPESWDTEDPSTHDKVSRFVQEQITYMSQHPVLWHIQKTLEDTEFWKLKHVRQTNGGTCLGYSSCNVKRYISWGTVSKEPVFIIDCTQSGSQCYYGSNVKEVYGSMEIYTPSNDLMFNKSISSAPLPSRDKPKIEANCDLPKDPLGHDLVKEVKESMRQVKGLPFPHTSVYEWLCDRD